MMSRRRLLACVATASVVLAFDPRARRWLRRAEASPGGSDEIPRLDGTLHLDAEAREAASTDEGNIVRREPSAVLRPGSVKDIARMIRFCGKHGIHVAARGQAHSVFGQSLVSGGLVIEMASLSTIHDIGEDWADVDAGLLWKDLLAATLEVGLTPPVLTGYLGLSVGGTLSMGGVCTKPRAGVQIEHARALEVVTGEGEIVWCSETECPELFFGMLAGLGQLGVVTRAVLGLEPAPKRVRSWVLQYTDPRAFFRDLEATLGRGEFDHVYGSVALPALAALPNPAPIKETVEPASPLLGFAANAAASLAGSLAPSPTLPVRTGTWVYQLNLAQPYDPDDPDERSPEADGWLAGTSDLAALRQSYDQSYEEFALRVDVLVELLEDAGLWYGIPRPWVDVFLPGEVTEDYVVETVSKLSPDDVGAAGLVLLFPILRERVTRPLLCVPDAEGDWIFLFDILTSGTFPGSHNEAFIEQKLSRNRAMYDKARELGATLYPISAVRMSPEDWARHYGDRHDEFVRLKRSYDPNGIMTPGPRIF